ncbi:MAG: TauD/TfdA family dioxygenase [Alphaproteobacteria bacterium]
MITPGTLPPTVAGPSAWRGTDMAADPSWLVELDDDALAEIETAARAALATGDIAAITASDFPLPDFAPRLAQIVEDVMTGRGFVLLRGLPVERWPLEVAAAAYFGLGAHIGSARSQNAMGHLLGHVCDLGRDPADPSARIYQTNARQTFHTDSCDIVGLLCLKRARSGGESMLVSGMAVYNEVRRRDPELAAELFETNAIDRRGEVPVGMKGYYTCAPLTWHEGQLTVHYQRRYIDSAQRFDDAPRLTDKRIAALDLFDSVCEAPDMRLEMAFEPGDIQLVHNHVLLHDRLGFEDWDEPARRRHLLRLWLAPTAARPLPAHFAQRFGSVTPGNRGGVVTPATVEMCAPLTPQ